MAQLLCAGTGRPEQVSPTTMKSEPPGPPVPTSCTRSARSPVLETVSVCAELMVPCGCVANVNRVGINWTAAVAVLSRTSTLSSMKSLTTARSGLPSALRSAATTDFGNVPAANATGAPNWPPGPPGSTDTVPGAASALPLVTTRSGSSSPLKSATATEPGLAPAAKATCAANPAPPAPTNTDTVPATALATARSGSPSPLKSFTATASGKLPTANVAGWPKSAPTVPFRIDTVLEPLFATARSGSPSPLKSATATARGWAPTAKLTCGPKPPPAAPSSSDTLLEFVLATV